jgi:outer membrane biosynthesis protein TonB
MDVNQYMEQSLELQRRTAEALEALVKAGFQQVNVAHHSCGKTTGGSQVKHPETEVKDTPAETKQADTKQAEKKEEAKAETKQAEKKEEAKAETKQAETKKKRATADDARKALKAYAAVEGNDAAMELLTSLGAPSVSGLAEASTDEDDKLQQLIDKCAGK